jgi:predicted AlkP superfamily phosphohydrolase/phosphomutase
MAAYPSGHGALMGRQKIDVTQCLEPELEKELYERVTSRLARVEGRLQKKLVLLGIDGASWSILAPMISNHQMPNFRRVLSKSSVGTLYSTVPPDSPPSWTSMFTGVNPGKHGIVDFLLLEGDRFVPCFSRYRMCKSIWQMVSERGRKCIVINEPVTFPPEKINGILTTGLMTPPGSGNWIHPKELKREINMVAGGYDTDIPGDFMSIFVQDRERAAAIIENLALKVFRVSKYVASNFDWDILAVIFTSTDRLQHYWWHDADKISKHYERLDTMLGEYIKYADDQAADLIIVSDHGFGPAKRLFRLDEWLRESGLAVYKETAFSKALSGFGFTKNEIVNLWPNWRKSFTMLPEFLQDIIRKIVPEGRRFLDKSRSGAYAVASNAVFVSDNKKEDVAKQLSKVTDKVTGSLIFEKVLDREDVLWGPYAYRAPNLFLQPNPGYIAVPGGMYRGRAIEDVEKIYTGLHRPEGIFLHYQPNHSPTTVKSVTLRPWDVAALALDVLGIPIPDYFDGKPPSYAADD